MPNVTFGGAKQLYTLRKIYFHFLSHWMGYDRGDSFPFDLEPNGFPFGSKWKTVTQNCNHDHIPFNVKGKGMQVFSVLHRFTLRAHRHYESPEWSVIQFGNAFQNFNPRIKCSASFYCSIVRGRGRVRESWYYVWLLYTEKYMSQNQ